MRFPTIQALGFGTLKSILPHFLAASVLVPFHLNGAAVPLLKPRVEVEEEVYRYSPANNGAGPMWCAGSTCIVRNGTAVFASGLETLNEVQPLNNCRWILFQRTEAGWQRIMADPAGKTREPAPLVLSGEGRIVLSANPTTGTKPEPNGGPARPELWEFMSSNPAVAPEHSLPAWLGAPKFSEHSYRSFAADPLSGEIILFQNIGYTHAEWAFRDSRKRWMAQGQLKWPWGADYEKPQPIRVCYPNVSVKGRAVHFFGVSDIQEPRPEWRSYKKQLTGRDWDYDFRRLFYTWTPDITTKPFQDWIEITSREKAGGGVWPCDLWQAPDGNVHVLWTERAIDERLREKFFPTEKQSHSLFYGIIREGKLTTRAVVEQTFEGQPGVSGSAGRFQVAPGNRLFIAYYATGTSSDGKGVSENRVLEVLKNGQFSNKSRIPLQHPFSSYFTTTTRAGSSPSAFLDMLGQRSDGGQAISYARVRLF